MPFVDAAITRAMAIPKVYYFVQKVIAGPMHNRISEMIRSEIPDRENNKILDVGCGVGTYSELFVNAQYTGLDIDNNYIMYANRSFPKSNIRFVIGNAVFP